MGYAKQWCCNFYFLSLIISVLNFRIYSILGDQKKHESNNYLKISCLSNPLKFETNGGKYNKTLEVHKLTLGTEQYSKTCISNRIQVYKQLNMRPGFNCYRYSSSRCRGSDVEGWVEGNGSSSFSTEGLSPANLLHNVL